MVAQNTNQQEEEDCKKLVWAGTGQCGPVQVSAGQYGNGNIRCGLIPLMRLGGAGREAAASNWSGMHW